MEAPRNIRLQLSAQAWELAQQESLAFPTETAGFSVFHRVPSSQEFKKSSLDETLLGKAKSSVRRAGPAKLVEIGETYTILSVPIVNIDGQTSPVNLYYDTQGWIVAYLDQDAPASQAWQARALNTQVPKLENIETTLLDTVNEVLVEALALPALLSQEAGYYHWQYPNATGFLMFGSALGTIANEQVAFAVPDSFDVYEISTSLWVSGSDGACGEVTLDGATAIAKQCNRSFTHQASDLTKLSPHGARNLSLAQTESNKGATGALTALVYSAKQ
ncbi:MAG: hypothetical protein FJ316_00555 [SAR202 cluster bacterium]|nr:hypothetical protein [SAR202 cluster bacterium]